MENQKNFVRHVIQSTDILPIENEMLEEIKRLIKSSLGTDVVRLEKKSSEVLYDCYTAISGKKALTIKVNLSPDLPNFWKELIENNFSFHPQIICSSKENDILKFICFEGPNGILLSDVSNYPLSSKFNFINSFARDLKKMHQTKIKNEDDTLKIFNGMCPLEATMIYDPFPVSQLILSLKTLFKNTYQSNLEDCGVCHFDICPENIIFSNKEFKFLNFEYAANANIYIDLWNAREAMNISDESFSAFVNSYGLNKTKLHSYRQAADIFTFVYFNSKIIAEYMTFGVRNHIKLRYWINKSEAYYYKMAHKLFVEKKLDNKIREFYNLWK